MSGKQIYHLLQLHRGVMYWFKVRSTQFGHCEYASWVHCLLHICNTSDSYAQERRHTLGCLGQGKRVVIQELEASA